MAILDASSYFTFIYKKWKKVVREQKITIEWKKKEKEINGQLPF